MNCSSSWILNFAVSILGINTRRPRLHTTYAVNLIQHLPSNIALFVESASGCCEVINSSGDRLTQFELRVVPERLRKGAR